MAFGYFFTNCVRGSERSMTCATLSLEFSAERGDTRLRVVRQEPPWRAIRAFPNAAGEALVHLHNVSGGVLGGDDLRFEISLAARARCRSHIGATRVYRHREGKPDASHATVFRVGKDALLEYLPEPVIPFARSRFSQACEVHLDEGAGLIWWDTVSAGRVACGEAFCFESYAVDNAIYCASGPLLLERYCLQPKLQAMDSVARMGPFFYSATMYVCRVDASSRWLGLEAELNEISRELTGPGTLWGASSLARDGVVVRGMTVHAHQASQGLQRFWQAAKQSVWGRGAVLPRKIY